MHRGPRETELTYRGNLFRSKARRVQHVVIEGGNQIQVGCLMGMNGRNEGFWIPPWKSDIGTVGYPHG